MGGHGLAHETQRPDRHVLADVPGSACVAGGRLSGEPGQPPPAEPVFRTGVDLVQVAAIVRDCDYRLVGDLSAADFRVIEDGTPQQIAAFEHVSIPANTVKGPHRAAKAAPPDVASNDVLRIALVGDSGRTIEQRVPFEVVGASPRQVIVRLKPAAGAHVGEL